MSLRYVACAFVSLLRRYTYESTNSCDSIGHCFRERRCKRLRVALKLGTPRSAIHDNRRDKWTLVQYRARRRDLRST
jgi:hypothetical protein